MKYIFVLFLLAGPLLLSPMRVSAQMDHFEATIVQVQDKDISVKIESGPQKGKIFPVSLYDDRQMKNQNLRVGDGVLVSFMTSQQYGTQVVIVDHIRRTALLILFVLFIAVVLVVGRKKGILSLFAMIISFLIIGRLIMPQILIGNNPVIISLIGSLFIIPSLFYIAHGFNTKTTIAVIGTFLSLMVTGFLAITFVKYAKLTGFAAEEAIFIQGTGQNVDIQSLLLAGIIIGAMGVLDDITISQTSIVEKLIRANPKYTPRQLFTEAMDVGRDHIASLVNTLILVYAGASLPLFVLFYSSAFSYGEVINMELIATEIVRTLVSSIGIVLAVPLTTLIATWQLDKLRDKK